MCHINRCCSWSYSQTVFLDPPKSLQYTVNGLSAYKNVTMVPVICHLTLASCYKLPAQHDFQNDVIGHTVLWKRIITWPVSQHTILLTVAIDVVSVIGSICNNLMHTAHRYTVRHSTSTGVLFRIMTLIHIAFFKLQSTFATDVHSCSLCRLRAIWAMMMTSQVDLQCAILRCCIFTVRTFVRLFTWKTQS